VDEAGAKLWMTNGQCLVTVNEIPVCEARHSEQLKGKIENELSRHSITSKRELGLLTCEARHSEQLKGKIENELSRHSKGLAQRNCLYPRGKLRPDTTAITRY
jgi:hypothetical protein